mgnify:CR=1 FL=1
MAGHVHIGMHWVHGGHPQEVPRRSVPALPGIDALVVMAMGMNAGNAGNADGMGRWDALPVPPWTAAHRVRTIRAFVALFVDGWLT